MFIYTFTFIATFYFNIDGWAQDKKTGALKDHYSTINKGLTKEQAFALLIEKEKLKIPIEKMTSRYDEKDKSWIFSENKNQLSLPVYIVEASGKTRVLLGH